MHFLDYVQVLSAATLNSFSRLGAGIPCCHIKCIFQIMHGDLADIYLPEHIMVFRAATFNFLARRGIGTPVPSYYIHLPEHIWVLRAAILIGLSRLRFGTPC